MPSVATTSRQVYRIVKWGICGGVRGVGSRALSRLMYFHHLALMCVWFTSRVVLESPEFRDAILQTEPLNAHSSMRWMCYYYMFLVIMCCLSETLPNGWMDAIRNATRCSRGARSHLGLGRAADKNTNNRRIYCYVNDYMHTHTQHTAGVLMRRAHI